MNEYKEERKAEAVAWVRAEKWLRCCQCRNSIRPGDLYQRVIGVRCRPGEPREVAESAYCEPCNTEM